MLDEYLAELTRRLRALTGRRGRRSLLGRMAKRESGPKSSTKAIPPALAHKLAARRASASEQRAAQTPPRGGHTPRPIRHQGR
jgi:hypothetical protein